MRGLEVYKEKKRMGMGGEGWKGWGKGKRGLKVERERKGGRGGARHGDGAEVSRPRSLNG